MLSAKLKELWFKYKNWEYCPTHCVRMVEYVPTYDVRAGHTVQGACPICYPELVAVQPRCATPLPGESPMT
jgi:hypothetical protein